MTSGQQSLALCFRFHALSSGENILTVSLATNLIVLDSSPRLSTRKESHLLRALQHRKPLSSISVFTCSSERDPLIQFPYRDRADGPEKRILGHETIWLRCAGSWSLACTAGLPETMNLSI